MLHNATNAMRRKVACTMPAQFAAPNCSHAYMQLASKMHQGRTVPEVDLGNLPEYTC